VYFYNPFKCEYFGGIALHDSVICGSTGELFKTDELIKRGTELGIHFDDIIMELDWIDLSDLIMGFR
jgi:hypothetical protein